MSTFKFKRIALIVIMFLLTFSTCFAAEPSTMDISVVTYFFANGNEVTIRTSVLKKGDNTLLAEEDVLNKTIDVKGIVTAYEGKVQIHVYTLNELIIA